MQKLKKELGLFDLFTMGMGAMLSSGLFILPGLIFKTEGPSISLSYTPQHLKAPVFRYGDEKC
ncbi:MAG: hypothetical protein ACOCV8_05685 [Spirochaetota bacterium]